MDPDACRAQMTKILRLYADRLGAVRNTLDFQDLPSRSAQRIYKSGVQPPVWAHEPTFLRQFTVHLFRPWILSRKAAEAS